MGAGLSVGTDGIGIDIAMPASEHFGLRLGMSFLPPIKFHTDVDIDSDDESFTTDEVEVEAKINKIDAKLLLDYYPFRKSSFHITAGAFIGPSKVIKAYNNEQFLKPSEWGTAGVKIGDYRVTSDENGSVQADVKVNAFKPYLGVGFGRAVPKRPISVSVDLGVQFWGKPGVYTWTKDDWGERSYNRLSKDDFTGDDEDSKDARDAIDVISKVKVYPVLSVRLCGRIF